MDETCLPVETPAATGASAVSWAAILAGAAAAVAISLTLFALAAGLGLVGSAALADAGAASALLWAALALIVTQWISAAIGGYLTGRLRTRWTRTHTHEVFFRDTAHGFITWCVATVFMASGLAAAASGFVGTRGHPVGISAHGRSQMRVGAGEVVHSSPAVEQYVPAAPAVAVPPAYGQLVLPDGPGSIAADETRRATIETLGSTEWRMREPRVAAAAAADELPDRGPAPLLAALSMVIGAFIASASAVLGGRQRDLHP